MIMPDRPRAMWLWDESAPPAEVVAFAGAVRVDQVFLTVPWGGPTAATRSLSRALRGGGVRVTCLGSGADWADVPDNAAVWAGRALTHGDFDGVHLDVEPWAESDWPARAERQLRGLARAVEAVRATTALTVEVDLSAGVVADFPELFAPVMSAASSVTLMAYRDRAPAILELSEAARRVAASVGRPYRIGVDTRPSPDAHTTFADDGRRALEQQTAAVADLLHRDPLFAGIAVHDFAGWRRLGP